MSTEQPENDPFRKPDRPEDPTQQDPQSHGGPPPAPPPPGAGGPYEGGGPYNGAPYPGGGGPGRQGGPYGAPGPYPGAGPYDGTPPGMPPLANRGKRLLARIVDALIIGIPVGIVVGLAEGWSTNTGQTYWQQAVYTLVYLLYEGLMLTTSGQTLGKKLLRIRVAMFQDGAVPAGTPGWFRAAVYSVPALVPCLGFLFWLVNVLFCTWDQPYHQCLHDKAARTVVVAAD